MPSKTWVMLDGHDFLSNDRIYMPLYLEGASAGGILTIRGDLLSAPAPPPPPDAETPATTQTQTTTTGETVSTTGTTTGGVTTSTTTITVPGGTTATITAQTGNQTTTQTQKAAFGNGPSFLDFFKNRLFAAPGGPLSTFNIWIGESAVLVVSERYSDSFEISFPINFFQSVPLLSSSYTNPPASSGGGNPSVETTQYGTFGNPLELGDFGAMFAEITGGGDYPTVSSSTISTTVEKLTAGYHPAFIEVITNGNTWRIHIEISYDYDALSTSTDYPVIKNIILNKTINGLARVSWNTSVKCDRNWVVYGTALSDSGGILNSNTVDGDTGNLYPGANLPMTDGTWYHVQIFSESNGKTSNSSVFSWKMPDANIAKTSDLTTQANSDKGLQGNGEVVDITGDQQQVQKQGQFPLVPVIIVGAVSAIGLGGAAWYLMQRGKG